MKKLLALILALLMLTSAFVACNDEEETSSSTPTSSSEEPTSSSTPDDTTKEPDNNKDENSASITKIDYNVDVSQSFNPNTFDLSSFGNTDKAESYPDATPVDATGGLLIKNPGVYLVTGESTTKGIEIDIAKTTPLSEVVLVLDGVQIQTPNTESLPPIYSKGCNLRIILLKDKRNILFDNRVIDPQTNSQKGAVYVKTGNLTIEGEGELKVETKFKNAIYCTKSITINGGVFDLKANYNGIYAAGELRETDTAEGAVGGLTINSGDFKIDASRSAIKAGDLEVESDTNVKGTIEINGGKFNLKSSRNAIDAYGSIVISSGGFEIESSADGINASDKVAFAGEENVVLKINSKDSGIKSDNLVSIAGLTNIKIITKKDGVKAKDIEVDTTGVLYIVTNPDFSEDMDNGEYIRDENKVYHKVDTSLYPNSVLYSVKESAKGLDAKDSITISGGTIAIDSVEEAISVTDAKKDLTDEQKAENETNPNKITIKGGTLVLDSSESAIKAESTPATKKENEEAEPAPKLDTITIEGAATQVSIYRADKGLNANYVIISDAKLAVLAITDAIDAIEATVNSGTVYLFDKVDIVKDGAFVVNGGTVICLSTTKTPKTPTSSTIKVLAKTLENPADYVYGNCINIKGGAFEATLMIPKSYAEKLSVVAVSGDITAGEYTISAGTYEGAPVFFAYNNGVFTAKSSEKVTVE